MHHAQRFAAMLGRPALGDQGRATGELAAQAEADDDAEGRELGDRLGEPAEGGKERIDRDAADHGARAPEAVGDDAENEAPGGRRELADRAQEARHRLRHPQVSHEVGQDHGIDHEIHAVEHPAQGCRDQGASLLWGGGAVPG